MNDMESGKLFQEITNNALFSSERHRTKALLETIFAKIAPKLEKPDFNALSKIGVCAPNKPAVVCSSHETPVLYLAPELEAAGNPLETEHEIVYGLANAIVLSKNVGRPQRETEMRRIVETWGYPAPASTEQRAGAHV